MRFPIQAPTVASIKPNRYILSDNMRILAPCSCKVNPKLRKTS